ncbi:MULTISPECIES: MmcQ/YjbR family DNA-binding protein [unclassified Gilliamella]|jgi:predicted DNA-binding protein (MmcQ/YjbR family)|nr:MmcQ/YjbR family DNA-binding protein [Gilliamella apicola]OCG19058.1 MmcQ family protein [Gilliamella apicola]OCG27163.1 MmcQ family protein [Gilliamella apicola]OCG29283.1 MmcQ family protein [Gilliamella apicola]OCG42268.1 MmcQ family protein [Gilliamella apicola]OCG60740.1 MmcQ family protein [Gilliamella apicola]
MSLKNRLVEYTQTLNNVQIDNPFKKFPDYQVLRHKSSGKWFGLIMSVEKNKLGLNSEEVVEIIDVKSDPELISIIKNSTGLLPAYHMNKNNWITIMLDGSVPLEQIIHLLDYSYNLTNKDKV